MKLTVINSMNNNYIQYCDNFTSQEISYASVVTFVKNPHVNFFACISVAMQL